MARDRSNTARALPWEKQFKPRGGATCSAAVHAASVNFGYAAASVGHGGLPQARVAPLHAANTRSQKLEQGCRGGGDALLVML
jgi:hypothetical protein